ARLARRAGRARRGAALAGAEAAAVVVADLGAHPPARATARDLHPRRAGVALATFPARVDDGDHTCQRSAAERNHDRAPFAQGVPRIDTPRGPALSSPSYVPRHSRQRRGASTGGRATLLGRSTRRRPGGSP